MTLSFVLLWSIMRAAFIASAALFPAAWIAQKATSLRHDATPLQRLICLTAALIPLFVPELVIGFNYRMAAERMVHSVWATEALYGLLLFFRGLAAQILVHLLLPAPAADAETLHSWQLLRRPTVSWWLNRLRLVVFGPARVHLVGWCVAGLLCFQDFETAALIQVDRHPICWTVWLFDAHQLGDPLTRSLSFAWIALFVELLILIPLLRLITVRQVVRTEAVISAPESAAPGRFPTAVIWCCLTAALVFFLVWPVVGNSTSAVKGLVSLVQRPHQLKQFTGQIVTTLGVAITSSVIALHTARILRTMKSELLTILLLLPGLCGSLILSLTLLKMFQWPGMNVFYDTLIPMILGQTALMLPRAWLITVLLDVLTPESSVHSAVLLKSSRNAAVGTFGSSITWRFRHFRWLLAFTILTHWCYWDVTVASLLHPVRLEPVVTRLYDLMHYGRNETLAAITLLALVLPWTAFFAIGACWRFVDGWLGNSRS